MRFQKILNATSILIALMGFTSTTQTFAAPKNLNDAARELYGTNLKRPAPNSLVGKYLAETHAKTLVRRFLSAPEGNVTPPSRLGDEKLVVAVSPDTIDAFRKYFSVKNLLIFFHEPREHTLITGFKGNRGMYGQHRDPIRFTAPDTLLIPVLLSDAEGERTDHFFNLAELSFNLALYPWTLVDADQNPYSAASDFQDCTSWFGNIPLGDQLVDQYRFPKRDDENGTQPHTQKLRPYSQILNFGPIPQEWNDAVRKVWTVPGRATLSEVLNQTTANFRGEFANPGWIAYTLLGSVKADRIPVIFIYVNDHEQPIDPNFDPQIVAQ